MTCLDQERNNSKGRRADSPPDPKRQKSFYRDIINVALDGDCGPLQEYIDNFDMNRAKCAPMSQAEWERVLPAWKSKDKSRGLKAWKSKTVRGEWNITGVCAKIINKAVSLYMEIFGLPPVFEGEKKSGSSTLSVNSEGLDLYTPFVLTVHRAYCQLLNPEVEPGMVAYDKVCLINLLDKFVYYVRVCRFFNT